MTSLGNLRISHDRLWESLAAAGEIGRTPDGGVRRLALSAEDGAMRDLFVEWCEAAGCTVRIDGIGNIFARRAGRADGIAPVLVGSHLDSQFSAGRYDGTLGVLAGLELMRTLDEAGVVLERPVEVVAWTNEEGARFAPPMMGSGAFSGELDLEEVLATRDEGGVTVGDALAAIGYAGDSAVGGRAIDSYWELHIEQGPELERAGVSVGIPARGIPARNLRITVTGETAHAGPTPMPVRKNALVGAAAAIGVVDRIARAYAPDAKSTSTRIEAWPNVPGIVPGKATILADIRHPDRAVLDGMIAELGDELADAAADANVELVLAEAYRFGGLEFDPRCVDLLVSAAEEAGFEHRVLMSQAGHDAYRMTAVCPTAMIMCPCRDGISHNPAESIDPDAIAPAVDVFVAAVLRRAGSGAGAVEECQR